MLHFWEPLQKLTYFLIRDKELENQKLSSTRGVWAVTNNVSNEKQSFQSLQKNLQFHLLCFSFPSGSMGKQNLAGPFSTLAYGTWPLQEAEICGQSLRRTAVYNW